MNLIQQEALSSQEFDFERDDNGLVKLTLRNVALAEAIVRADSRYAKTWDKTQRYEKGKNPGSTAFWMTEWKKSWDGRSECTRDDILMGAIQAINRENSTRLAKDERGMKSIFEKLKNFSDDEVKEHLQHPRQYKYKLLEEIAKAPDVEGGKRHLSFASKFCHYACFFMFEGEDAQDNYSIYDSVVKKAVPKYLEAYGIPFQNDDFKEYSDYQNAIDALREKAGAAISRNGFDHLIWYSYKGK